MRAVAGAPLIPVEMNPKGLEMIKRLLDTALALFDAEHSDQVNADDETAVRLVVKARELLDIETGGAA